MPQAPYRLVQSGHRPGSTKAPQTSKTSANLQLGSTLPATGDSNDPPEWDVPVWEVIPSPECLELDSPPGPEPLSRDC